MKTIKTIKTRLFNIYLKEIGNIQNEIWYLLLDTYAKNMIPKVIKLDFLFIQNNFSII